MANRERAAMNLDVIAATAKKLADDLRAARLWPGEAALALEQIESALRDARMEVGHDR